MDDPKNTAASRSEYPTLPIPASVATIGSPHCTGGMASTKTVSAKNISFERKPLSNGTPAMAAVATSASVPVIGMRRNRPDRRRMSRVPVSWSMIPTAMNSDALNAA